MSAEWKTCQKAKSWTTIRLLDGYSREAETGRLLVWLSDKKREEEEEIYCKIISPHLNLPHNANEHSSLDRDSNPRHHPHFYRTKTWLPWATETRILTPYTICLISQRMTADITYWGSFQGLTQSPSRQRPPSLTSSTPFQLHHSFDAIYVMMMTRRRWI